MVESESVGGYWLIAVDIVRDVIERESQGIASYHMNQLIANVELRSTMMQADDGEKQALWLRVGPELLV